LVISERGRIRGVFTQKKILWETMKFDGDDKHLTIAMNETKFTDMTYSKMCRYLKERKILQIYDVYDADCDETATCRYIIWEIETNTYYDPVLPDSEEDEEEVYADDN